jgi:hypothetical protein
MSLSKNNADVSVYGEVTPSIKIQQKTVKEIAHHWANRTM